MSKRKVNIKTAKLSELNVFKEDTVISMETIINYDDKFIRESVELPTYVW